jgi:pimeloyl-ACP methyl ester carboxylesterase
MLPSGRVSAAPSDDPKSEKTRDVLCKDARVRVSEQGSAQERPLLLIHDFLSDRGEWDEVAGPLAERFRVLSVDLPGFGESEKPTPGRFGYDLDRFAAALVDVAGALDAAPLSVCGHGLGAAIAIALAERHPPLVERLVLVAPPLFGAKPVSLARVFAVPVVGPVAFKQLYGRGALGWHFRRDVFAAGKPAPERIARLYDAFNAPAAREAASATLEALRDTRAVEARLSRVASPALVAWGRRDVLAPPALGRKLARALPDARLELFDCGHSPAEETPARFAEAALEFLAPRRATPRVGSVERPS